LENPSIELSEIADVSNRAERAPTRHDATKAAARWWNSRRAWAHIAGASALIATAVYIGKAALDDVLMIALSDPESSHVLLVPIVFAWLSWHHRQALRWEAPRQRWVGTCFIAGGWLLWSAGYRFEYQCFWHAGAISMALGALLTVTGVDPFLALLPAFGACVFLVPVPGIGRELVAAPLQRVTAEATQFTAELFGMNIQRTGSLLRINGIDVAVAEACNGMRLVFTLFMACYVFAFINPFRWQIRLLILLLSPVIAVAANVTRLVPTVWAYGRFSRESAEQLHDAAGWAMLVLAFLALTGLVRLLRWAGVPVDAT
jgi:exosortase